MSPAQLLLDAVSVYAAVGLVFAVPFVLVGIRRIDKVASHAPLKVRVLFLPGSVALWPVLLAKWRASARRDTP